nr:M15 family metallopeptidase [uncultured Undibacterium sp.]
MKNSRDLKDLVPSVAAKCAAFVSACKAESIDVLITSTLRDNESQAALYAQGRTTIGINPRLAKPLGDVVTNAKAGESFHNYGVAFDFVPMVNGKAQWDDTRIFTKCGVIAESLGLEWAGRWKGSLRELAHCQFTGGLTLQDLKNGKQVK